MFLYRVAGSLSVKYTIHLNAQLNERTFITRQTCGTSSENEWQRMTTSDNQWQGVTTSGTASDNEWRQLTTSGTTRTTSGVTSDKEWQRVIEQVTTSDNK